MSQIQPNLLLAIDPGRAKFGWALLESGQVSWKGIEPVDELEDWLEALPEKPWEAALGDGTGSQQYISRLKAKGLRVHMVPEKGSTDEAKGCYFKEEPEAPRGLRGGLRRLLNLPDRPVDDWAAVVIGRRYLDALKGGGGI